MAASGRLFEKYMWLAQTIHSAGEITFREIERRWVNSSLNDEHDTRIPKRTFLRWKEGVEVMFHLVIEYNHTAHTYHIANGRDMTENRMQQWMLNAFSVQQMVATSSQMRERILLEDMPSGERWLNLLVDAMQQNHLVQMTYQRFDANTSRYMEMAPFCLKAFKQRWYIVGESSDHPGSIRIYALDRVHDMQPTDKTFQLPADFDGATYLKPYYGTWTGNMQAEEVIIRVSKSEMPYLRSLPLHHSQRELGPEKNSEYERIAFTIAPTPDFIMELLSFGENIEVVAPESLRQQMAQKTKAMAAQYNH